MGRPPGESLIGGMVCQTGTCKRKISPPIRDCMPPMQPRRIPRDDEDREPRPRCFMERMPNWMEGRGRSRYWTSEREHGSGWYHGDSSAGRRRAQIDASPPPSHSRSPQEEKRALWWLWETKDTPYESGVAGTQKRTGNATQLHKIDYQVVHPDRVWAQGPKRSSLKDVIVIEPQESVILSQERFSSQTPTLSDAILIKPVQGNLVDSFTPHPHLDVITRSNGAAASASQTLPLLEGTTSEASQIDCSVKLDSIHFSINDPTQTPVSDPGTTQLAQHQIHPGNRAAENQIT
jgi:hypothetical protein